MQFPEIIHAAYAYKETAKFLQEPLISTGLPPHFGLAIDKSTPHRETNQAIILLVPSGGKHVAVPIDAPVVYTVNPDSDDVEGGNHDYECCMFLREIYELYQTSNLRLLNTRQVALLYQ